MTIKLTKTYIYIHDLKLRFFNLFKNKSPLHFLVFFLKLL